MADCHIWWKAVALYPLTVFAWNNAEHQNVAICSFFLSFLFLLSVAVYVFTNSKRSSEII